MLNTERRNRRGNREIRFEVNSNYYEAVSKLLSDYKRVLKENEELKNQEATARKINELLVQRYSNSISVQKVKDKIEELIKEGRHYNASKIEVLQELLEKR